jgi:hypothetical protein
LNRPEFWSVDQFSGHAIQSPTDVLRRSARCSPNLLGDSVNPMIHVIPTPAHDLQTLAADSILSDLLLVDDLLIAVLQRAVGLANHT